MRAVDVKRVLMMAFMLAVSIFTVIPFYIMIIMGTYYSNDLFKSIVLAPSNYLMENFKVVLASNYFRFYFNSVYISTVVALLAVLVSAMAGYAFAKYSFRFKKAIFNCVLATMMIPGQLGLIAFVWQMKKMGMLGSHLPLIIPPLASTFGVFWMTQYIKGSVPSEVIESARIDGCTEITTFLRIVLPFVKPALISLGLLFYLWNWNSYLVPLVTVSKMELYTVPLGISILKQLYRVDYGAQLLGLSMSTIPIIILFVAFSKHFISGLTSVAVKG